MNKLVLIFVLLSSVNIIALSQQIITVDNNPNSPARFKNLQEAIDSAKDGDVIYVSGSLTSYGEITIRKRLSLYGAGYRPNKDLSIPSTTGNVNLAADSATGTSSSGSKIIGFSIHDEIWGHGFDDIEVSRNYVEHGVSIEDYAASDTAWNWLIQDNDLHWSERYGGVPSAVTVRRGSNIVISNNIVRGGNIGGSNKPSVIISNNLFLGYAAGAFNDVLNATIVNNIFYGLHPRGCSYCVFNNNITFNTSNDTLPYGNNTGTGNLVGVDPQFINYPGSGFDYSYDFHLKPTSPAIGAGTGGTDIGLYGAPSPIQIGGDPPLPLIKRMVIDNVVSLNGTLHIQAAVKAQK